MFALPENATLEEVRAFFERDRFPTTTCRPVIEEASHGHALVRMAIQDHHINGFGTLMGGVTFTIADYAFGIAANIGQPPTVSVGSSVDFIGVAQGEEILVACDVEKDGRSLCFAVARVVDDRGNLVARINFTGFRKV